MNINLLCMAGNITKDIELRYTPNGLAVANFTIANNKKYKDKETVTFIDCTAFGKTAETLSQYLVKGSPVYVQGRLQQEHFETKDGQKRSKHSILVNEFQFIPKPKGGTDE